MRLLAKLFLTAMLPPVAFMAALVYLFTGVVFALSETLRDALSAWAVIWMDD